MQAYMKTKTLLILLFCWICFSSHAQQLNKQEADLTKSNKNMTNVELRENIVMALGRYESQSH